MPALRRHPGAHLDALVLGLRSESGFDAIEECFEEMTPFIFALETGLSSDPPMNWRLSALDKYALVSNSDAHSPSQIGREANVVEADFSYKGLVEAIRGRDPARFLYTVEFFPEEGKYHYDGHRKCGVVLSPKESMAHGDLCPACGKKLTIGVMHRVEELADRDEAPPAGSRALQEPHSPERNHRRGLRETADCQSVWDPYFRFIREFGDEHRILTEVPSADLARLQPEKVARGIERMRKGLVKIAPGHDGEYGVIQLFEDEEDKPRPAGPPRCRCFILGDHCRDIGSNSGISTMPTRCNSIDGIPASRSGMPPPSAW